MSRAILISRITSLVSVSALRDPGGGSGEHRASSVLGVDRVALAALATVTPIGSAGLHDALIVAPEVADETLPVGATALDAEAPRITEGLGPRQELLIATAVRRDRHVAESLPVPGQHDSHVDVLVGVHANRHLSVCHSLQDCLLADGGHMCSAGRAGGQDCEGNF